MKDKILLVSRVLDSISKKMNGISCVLLAVITLFILAEIVARRFFSYGFHFVLEVNTYMLAAAWFLSASYTLRTDGHIRVNILTGVVKSDLAVRILDIIATVIGIMICIVFFQAVFQFFWDSYTLKRVSYSALRAPLYIPQFFIMFGMGFMLLQMVMRLVLLIINEPPDIDLKSKK